ncbi:MAG: four helix bundle protein [Nitrospirae bacterium]|nr:four helix bundle protein [Nitrospirota bacterium]
MSKVNCFQDLNAWQVAHRLIIKISEDVKTFPKSEQYKLIDQIERSSRSVTANIAEGFRKSSSREKAHFYEIALTSLDETKNHLIAARDLTYLDEEKFKQRSNLQIKTNILLTKLLKSVRNI